MYKLTCVSSIGGFLFGYDTGILAGAILYFKDTWPDITSEQTSMIVSIALLGAFLSCIIAGPLCDKFGRKPMIILADIFFIFGSITEAFANDISSLMYGRFLVGIAIGASSIVVPIYLSEISPNEMRGTIVGMNSTMCPVG